MWENLIEKRNGHYASVTGYLTMLSERTGGKKSAIDFLEKLCFVNDDATGGKVVLVEGVGSTLCRQVFLKWSKRRLMKGREWHGKKPALQTTQTNCFSSNNSLESMKQMAGKAHLVLSSNTRF